MALGELIQSYDVLNTGRIKINNFYSGTTNIWSGSVGTYSVIRNNVNENLGNSALGFNSMAAGFGNRASGNFSVAFWGSGNTATTSFSSIASGRNNKATGTYSFIGGGFSNSATSVCNFIGGGQNNLVSSTYATIAGGVGNIVSGNHSFAAGRLNTVSGAYSTALGNGNTASGIFSTVNGQSCTASGTRATVCGGYFNQATNTSTAIVGGQGNQATGVYSIVGGGLSNKATGNTSVVTGGWNNKSYSPFSFIGGGSFNKAVGAYSTVGGGYKNRIYSSAGPSNSTIAGGRGNIINSFVNSQNDFIGGGSGNSIVTYYTGLNVIVGGYKNKISYYSYGSFIGGGQLNNAASSTFGSIVGGSGNYIQGLWNSIIGGRDNRINSNASSVINGRGNYASNAYSVAMGGGAQTRANFSLVVGNVVTSTPNVANNTISLSGSVGYVIAEGGFQTNTADYAEYFEWNDGNPNAEDRRGYFVSLVNDKIEIGNSDIIGIISSAPGVMGDAAEFRWSGMYEKDDWNKVIYSNYTQYNWVDNQTLSGANYDFKYNTVFKNEYGTLFEEYPHSSFPTGKTYDGTIPLSATSKEVSFPKMNPNYIQSGEYIPRSSRPEWSPVGLLGKIHARTAEPITGNSIDVNAQGMAINGTKYRVLNTIRPHTESQYGIVRVFFK